MDIKISRRAADNGGSLCEDILLQILPRLPFKSLHKFKSVSKQWFSLITHQVLPKFLGFYFHHSRSILWKKTPCVVGLPNPLFRSIDGVDDEKTDTSIDTSLSFLPSRDFWVLDHCNGLVLCFETKQHILYVCNPATKLWDSVRAPRSFYNTRLAFDPLISRHYKLVSTVGREKDGHSSCLETSTYSSEEVGIWKEERLFDLESYFKCLNVGYSAFYNGALFVAFFGMMAGSGSGRIVQVDLLSEVYRLIDFPEHAKRPVCRAAIGKMGDGLCYGELHGQQLRIWVLGGEHQDTWVMEHEKTLNVLKERLHERNQILAFHPFMEAVYILSRGRVFVYDLNSMSLEEVCTLETDELRVTEAMVFPFIPCLRDALGEGK